MCWAPGLVFLVAGWLCVGGTVGATLRGVSAGRLGGSVGIGGAGGVSLRCVSLGRFCVGGTVAVVGDDAGLRLRRMLVSDVRVADSLVVSEASGELGDGCWSAWMMSWAAAMTMSVEEAVGMGTCSGNQVTVSGVRSLCVSHIQMR